MGPVTGPTIVPRVDHHPCPNRIQLDVSEASQKISLFLNEARPKPTFEKGATARIGIIEVSHVSPAQGLHQARQRLLLHRLEQEMYVIGHEHPTMNLHVVFGRAFAQPMCIGGEVSIAGKQRLTVVATLDDMRWNPDRTISAASGQTTFPISVNSPHTHLSQPL